MDAVQKAKYRLMYIFTGAVALAIVAANILSSDNDQTSPEITQAGEPAAQIETVETIKPQKLSI